MSEYFVSGTEQICRTVSPVGVAGRAAVLTIPKWFMQESEGPRQSRLPDSEHCKSQSLLTEQPPMGSALSSEHNRVVCPYALACWAPEVDASCFQIGTDARN
jgi:hypothetical protein